MFQLYLLHTTSLYRRNKGPLSIRFARPECIMESDIDHEQRAFLDVTNLLEQPLGKLAFSRYLAGICTVTHWL